LKLGTDVEVIAVYSTDRKVLIVASAVLTDIITGYELAIPNRVKEEPFELI